MAKAKQEELDLVEVAPDSDPPVCKIMDYARYFFEQKRKLKESRKKAKAFEMKEIKLKPRIDPHDYGIKLMHLKEFVEKGHKVKVTLRFRMNELRHANLGRAMLRKLVAESADVAEEEPNQGREESNKVMTVILAPKKKKG